MLKQTPSQTIGPFFHHETFFVDKNILVNEHTQGKIISIKGHVFDGDGAVVPDAMVEIWQADSQGIFKHPADPHCEKADQHFRGFGRSDTVNGGQFWFKTVKPGRVQDQAPHINVRVFGRGMLKHVITRLYFADEESANQTDPVLNLIPERRQTLIAQLDEPDTYCFNIVLQGEHETVFFNP